MTSGQDLDSFLTPGVYDCNSESIASTLLHCPVTKGFRLIATMTGYGTSSYMVQFIVMASGVGYPRVFMRGYIGTPPNGSWTDWELMPRRAEMDAVTSAMNNISFISENIDAGTVTYNVPVSYRGILYVLDSSVNRNGMYIVTSTGSGAVSMKDISVATEIEFDTSTAYKLSITVPTGSRRIVVMNAVARQISRTTTS